MLWLWIFNPEFGLLNYALSSSGLRPTVVFDVGVPFHHHEPVGRRRHGDHPSGRRQGIPTHLAEAAEQTANSKQAVSHYSSYDDAGGLSTRDELINTFQVFTCLVMTNGGLATPASSTCCTSRHAFQYFNISPTLAWCCSGSSVFHLLYFSRPTVA